MVNHELAPVIYFLMIVGNLTALNKIPEAEQEKLRQAGKDPKYRPVNGGASFIKTALRVAMSSESGKRALNATKPTQMGCGQAAGPESVVHLARQQCAEGAAIGCQDVINAFNELNRQDMLT